MACSCSHSPTVQDYLSPNIYTWCTNCGNYGIHGALRRALVAENICPCNLLLVFDIGCHGNGSDKIGGYRFHGLHGRALPFACGATAANPNVKVMAIGGDGGTLAEGIGHLITAVRGNFNITFLFHNNLNYGLTTGQPSPTTKPGMKMNAAPEGITSDPIHPARFLMSLDPSFYARTFSGDIKHMTEVMRAGLQWKGFSFIEILQSCPTYNKATPHEWYQERVHDISTIPGYDNTNLNQAREAAEDLENSIAVGILYKNSNKSEFIERQTNRAQVHTTLVEEVQPHDVTPFLQAFV